VPNADAVNVQLSAFTVPPALDNAPMPVIVELLMFKVPVGLFITLVELTETCALIVQLFSIDTPLFCNPLARYVPPEIVQLLAVNVPDTPTSTQPLKLVVEVLIVQFVKTTPPDITFTTHTVLPPPAPYKFAELIVSVPDPVIVIQCMLLALELGIEALVSVALPEAE
jgi:hypothetical protein